MSKSKYETGYRDALKNVHKYLIDTYQTEFDWEDINRALNEALQELGEEK